MLFSRFYVLYQPGVDVLPAALLSAVDRKDVSSRTQRRDVAVAKRHVHISARPPRKAIYLNAIQVDFRVFVVMYA